ncbi:MAG: RNA polymerase sigma factor [Candidatus Aminicenantales bacterium]
MPCLSLNLRLRSRSRHGLISGQYVTMSLPAEEERMKAEEISLIKRSQQGETEAMEKLYDMYKKPLFNLVYRHTYNFAAAEDLLQDIFIKIFTNLQNIKVEGTFRGWVYRIALNTCYSYLRDSKNRIQKTVALEGVEHTLKQDEPAIADRSLRKPLEEAIKVLPPRLKSVFLLHDVQGFKHEEISQMLGCAVGTSKSQLFKARLKIRNYLKSKQII